ncbi:UNVERIFIED_CONTAM: hypothetical protein K2H54_034147 [Gekko kuhli]
MAAALRTSGSSVWLATCLLRQVSLRPGLTSPPPQTSTKHPARQSVATGLLSGLAPTATSAKTYPGQPATDEALHSVAEPDQVVEVLEHLEDAPKTQSEMLANTQVFLAPL